MALAGIALGGFRLLRWLFDPLYAVSRSCSGT
jgi:hypothetical protein